MADQPKPASTRAIPPQLNSALRKPTPSPLQVSQISTPISNNFGQSSPRGIGSPHSPRAAGTGGSDGIPSASRSPHYSPVFLSDPGESPNGGNLRPTTSRNATQDSIRSDVSQKRKNSPLATPRGNEQPTARDIATSSNITNALTTDSPPQSPSDIVNTKTRIPDHRPIERLGPRTSSIDSTMSSVSSTTSYSHASSDPLSPNPAEIAQMIASAGSTDALIRQLAKERKQSAAQNAQLWRLINKQRTLVIGLNADLARAIEDKEKYHRRWKELNAIIRPQSSSRVEEVRKVSPSGGNSSAGHSDDELPIQRHSVVDESNKKVLDIEKRISAQQEPSDSVPEQRLTTILNNPAQIASQISSTDTSPSMSSEGMPKVTPDSEASDSEFDDDSRRNTIMQANFKPIAPLEIHKKVAPTVEPPLEAQTPPLPELDTSSSSLSSFSARRSITTPRKSANNSPQIGGDSPVEGQRTISPVLRKGPPAPLNLQQKPVQPPQPMKSPQQINPQNLPESEHDEVEEAEEILSFERGRKKTREEDDKEREYIMKIEVESRSQSKKQKRAKSGSKSAPTSGGSRPPEASPSQSLPKSPSIRAFSPNESPTSLREHFSPHASLAGVLSGPSSSANSITEQTVPIASPPLSPGLPRSPRPVDRPLGSPNPRAPIESNVSSPPLSPRPATLSPPVLSPRAPRHPIPLPPHTPNSLTSPPHSVSEEGKSDSTRSRSPALQPAPTLSPRSPKSPEKPKAPQSPKSPQKALSPQSPKSPQKTTSAPLAPVSSNSSSENMPGGIYRGLVSEAHPDLLLAPNALPLILVKVTSSRLRPSRHSMLSMKSMEEDPVFTLGITARSNMKQLWRAEKPILSLPQLDQQLKQVSSFEFRLPDRSLFQGHAPAKIDARREALEKYFEDLLDTPMNDKAGLILCQFLSTQVVPVEDYEGSKAVDSHQPSQHPIHLGPEGKIVKEGFLTKRGKNFGGWKARYFVLDEPILRYYESPGGALLGTVKLTNAQIGRQQAHHSTHSPSRGGEEDDKFRHAFLILEPKKKDSSSFVRHVLCAENDEERDEWVTALLQYVGQPAPESKSKSGSKGILHSMMKSGKEESPVGAERGHEDSTTTLQGVNYKDTVAGQPVKVGPNKEASSSPMANSFNSNQGMAPPPPKTISGPTNGAVIENANAWGSKPMESPKVKDKEKGRSLWSFRAKQPDSNAALQNAISAPIMPNPQNSPPNGRQVFGMPLIEAVEAFPVRGTDLALPAVVYRCLEYLEAKEAQNEEGIFRLSGSNVTIKQLRERFNTEGDVDFLAEGAHYDVHAIASLLKAYLRELPNTVLGYRELHLQFLQVLGLPHSRILLISKLTFVQSWMTSPRR